MRTSTRTLGPLLLTLLMLLTGLARPAPASPAAPIVVTESAALQPEVIPEDYLFGPEVAFDGATIVVGADNGNEFNGDPGSAYVFSLDATGAWIEGDRLQPTDGQPFDQFGTAVGVSGDVIAVGASHVDDLGDRSGAAYVFDLVEGAQQQKLHASDGSALDSFGLHLALDGDVLLVGAHGVLGGRGAAYVFEPDADGTWTERAKLLAPDGGSGDNFGRSLALSGSLALIGARGDDDSGPGSGSAYVFRRSGGGSWTFEAKLTAPDGEALDFFGYSVDVFDPVDGTDALAVVGARGDGDQGWTAGAAYVFARPTRGQWTLARKLLASDGVAYDSFGRSVAVSGDLVLVGADDQGEEAEGVVYAFISAAGGGWTEVARLEAAQAAPHDALGWSLALAGSRAVAAAPGVDVPNPGSGMVYVFDVDLAPDPCPADLNGDGDVGLIDLIAVLGTWGPCAGCPADLDESGDVGFGDLLLVLGTWGACGSG